MNDEPTAAPPRPTGDHDSAGWQRYKALTSHWKAQRMPWRTEAEIDEARLAYLAERRAIQPDIFEGIYPFKDIEPQLTRADIEWLLATHNNGRGPVLWEEEEKGKPYAERRPGLDLRGGNLSKLDLRRLPLAGVRGALAFADSPLVIYADEEHFEVASAHLEGSSSIFPTWMGWQYL